MKRLSGAVLESIRITLERPTRLMVGADVTREDALSMALELQIRRLRDLPEPQIEMLRKMLREACSDRPIVCGPERIDLLRDLLEMCEVAS